MGGTKIERLSFLIGIVSLVVGIVSIMLAIVSMRSSKKAEEQSLYNFKRTKELLKEINKKAATIDDIVQDNPRQMIITLKNILYNTVMLNKINIDEHEQSELKEKFLLDPEQAYKLFESLLKHNAGN